MYTYTDDDNKSETGGDITITGYQEVAILGDVHTYSVAPKDWDTNPYGGHVTIVAEEEILVEGPIDLGQYHAGREGILRLTTTSGQGLITLGELDCNEIRYARFDPNGKKSIVTGVLTNFNRAASGGTVVIFR